MATIRTFIAISVDHEITARLAALQQQFRQADADVAWARPDGMHLTVKFLGDVDEARIPAIGMALDEIAHNTPSFSLTVAGIGGFPNMNRPRVIWAGITTGHEEMTRLAEGVDQCLSSFGFQREERPYRAHLTIGRVKSPKNLAQLTDLIAPHRDECFGEMRATAIHLMRSELSPKGAKYTCLRELLLCA